MHSPSFLLMTTTPTPSHKKPSSTTPPRPSSRKSKSASTTPKKRVRPSHLSLKYRQISKADDESLLVSDATPTSNLPPSSCESQNSTSHSPSAANKPPVRLSKFPSTWSETKAQLAASVSNAVAHGHELVRVDIKHPELMAHHAAKETAKHVRLNLLVEAACHLVEQLRGMNPALPTNFGMQNKLTSAVLHFNSLEDWQVGRQSVPSSLNAVMDLHVLGDEMAGENRAGADVHVVLAPCNRRGNPEHIENVEAVHYSYWLKSKVIIMLNPDLMALTKFSTFSAEPRQPGFISDYVPSYYIDPAAYSGNTATGAVLRCFPRKWELYLLRLRGDMVFRLISEQHALPSAEQIKCLFAWRVERDANARDDGSAFSV